MKRLNRKWLDNGHCIRLAQRRGDPEALSDLIFGVFKGDTYSIEVKRITNKTVANNTHHKTRPLNFGKDFSIATNKKTEYPHQLVRQVIYCCRMGWIPLVLLQVVTPCVGTKEYLFSSHVLLEIMNSGSKSVTADFFPVYNNQLLYDYLFKIDKGD